MILFESILAGLILSLATGGSLSQLAKEPLRGEWLLLLALPAQLLWPGLSTRLGLGCAFSIIVWLLLMAVLAGVLMVNASRRWVLSIAALGIACNVLVIGVNQAMPVSIRAASEIGATRTAARDSLLGDCLHEELDDSTTLTFLGDVIPVPGPPWHRGVVSVGDLLLAFGLAGWVFVAARRAPMGAAESH